MKGVPFLNKRYIKGVPFLPTSFPGLFPSGGDWERGCFSAKMVYKRVKGWTSGRSLPVLNFVKYPPGQIYNFIFQQIVTLSKYGHDTPDVRRYRAFSHDVTAAILVFQNNETAAMLVYQTSPVGVELFSYVNTSFCSNKFACELAT